MTKSISHEAFIDKCRITNKNLDDIIFLSQYKGIKRDITLQCKVCGTIWTTMAESTQNGSGCSKCSIKKQALKRTHSHEDFVQKVTVLKPHIEVLGKYLGYDMPIKCRCKKDGYVWEAYPSVLLKENNMGCPCCANLVVKEGVNDIATIRPELVKYFKDKNEAKKYTVGTTKTIELICPDCQHTKKMEICNLTSRGFSCDYCSKFISMPNKFIRALCEQLPLDEYKFEYAPKWFKEHHFRYDCMFVYNNNKYIVEMDGGIGHGKKQYRSKQKDKEGLKNDIIKDIAAKEHGYTMIRINCEPSELNFIKNNILQSQLSTIFDLSKINWDNIFTYCCSNIVKQVCDDYNSMSVRMLMDKYKMRNSTIIKYLRYGTQCGWCDYIPPNAPLKIYLYDKDRLVNIFYSRGQCCNSLKITTTTISKYLDSNIQYKGYYFYSEIQRKAE